MSDVEISIILTVCNSELYITECLKSILKQTFDSFEVLCIDLGSSDKSIEIINEFSKKDSRIKLVTDKTNNAVFDMAKGKYIACIDSQDWVEHEYLECMHNAFEKYKLNSVWCKYSTYIQKTKETGASNFHALSFIKEGPQKLRPNSLWLFPQYSGNKMYRKSFLQEHNFVFPKNQFDDIGFYWRFYTQSPVYYMINKVLCTRRIVNADSEVSCFESEERDCTDIVTVFEDIYNYLIEKNMFDKYKFSFVKQLASGCNLYIKIPHCRQKMLYAMRDLLNRINLE